jgi:putative transposase
MMKKLRLDYPALLLSRLLQVSPSGYYGWVDRPLSERAREEMRLELEIKAAHQRTRQTYGAERMQHELAEHGIRIGVCRIKRIRRKLGLRCKQRRKFKATTDSRHSLPVAENLLGRKFKVSAPDHVWLSDITYVPTDEGWLYLAGHKDAFTKEIVGYAMGEKLTKSLISQSLLGAVSTRRPEKGLLHHSDRGSQYCSYEYQSLMKHFGLEASMSGAGNCYDNAPMESFWAIIKQELIHHRHYRTRREAMAEITEYIEIFYNRQRLQAGLGYLSPVAYIRQYYDRMLAA